MIRIRRIMFSLIVLALFSFGIPAASAAINFSVVEYTQPGLYTYTVPDEVRSVYVTVVGAGAGGGGGSGGTGSTTSSHAGAGAGGGGSGYYQVSTVAVTAGQTITIVVGAGGSGGSGGAYYYNPDSLGCSPGTDGTAGGSSQFGALILEGGSYGTGSPCYTTTGSNGAGGSVGNPPSGSIAGTGGAGYNGHGYGGTGGIGGYDINASYTGWGRGGNGTAGAAGYVRVEPIKPPAPVADFNMTPVSGQAPLTVHFEDKSIGYPTKWSWYYGDLSPMFVTTDPALKNPNHTFTVPGTYTVVLRAYNSVGNNAVTHAVYVTVPPAAPIQDPMEYIAPGIYNYTVAAEIRSVYVTLVGAGGGGGAGSGGGGNGTSYHYGSPGGGAGSGFGQITTVNVTPGQVIPVVVGLGGYGGIGGLYDYRYSPWGCTAGTDGQAGGYSQYDTIVMAGGQPGKGSPCFTTNGLNGTGYKDGSIGIPNPPLYTGTYGAGGTGGTGYLTSSGYRGVGGTGGIGGFNTRDDRYLWGNGNYGTDGGNGYVRIVPIKPPAPIADFNMTPVSGQAPLTVYFEDKSIGYPTKWSWYYGDLSPMFVTTDSALKNPNHTFTVPGTYTVVLRAYNSVGNNAVTHTVYVTGPPVTPSTNPVEYTVPGVYNYTVPAGIGLLRITLVGAGGGGGAGSGGGGNETLFHYGSPGGGAGSGFGNITNISVHPGQVIPVVVGLGGYGGIGGLYDYRYSPWGCTAGTDGQAGGHSQFGNITIQGGRPGGGSPCFTTNGLNGTGYHDGSIGIPDPARYTVTTGAGGTGGTGYLTSSGYRGAGGTGGVGGWNVKDDRYFWGDGNYGADGGNGYIRVEPFAAPAPVANFTAAPISGPAPLIVNFTDTSTGFPTSWSWDFGDGHSSSDKNPLHMYNPAGNFTVSLTVTNAMGSNSTVKQGYVTVIPGTMTYYYYAESGNTSDQTNAYRFYDTLHANSQNGEISWVEWQSGSGFVNPNLARESHWTSDSPNWVDNADFAYFSGHGFPNGFEFENQDSSGYYNAEASRIRLGTGRTKWAVIDACSSLNDISWTGWQQSFAGLHILLGWNTSTVPVADIDNKDRGEVFVRLMQGEYANNGNQKLPIIDAWDWTCKYTWAGGHHSEYDVWNAVIYDANCRYDYLPGWIPNGNSICTTLSGSLLYNSTLVFQDPALPSGTKSRSISLITGKYSINRVVPDTPEKIMVYASDKSGFTKESASLLAKNLGMSGEIRETEKAFIGSESDMDNFYFAIEKETSTISFQKFIGKSKQSQIKTQPIRSVDAFLIENHIMPSDTLKQENIDNSGGTLSRSGQRIVEQKTKVITLSREKEGLPVYNSQMMIERDSEGNIVKLFQNWRDYTPYKEVPLKTPETVFEEFQTLQLNDKGRNPDNIVITEISLGYYSHAPVDNEYYLQPIYVINGYFKNGESTQPFEPVIIAATDEVFNDVPGMVVVSKQTQKTKPKHDVSDYPTTPTTSNLTVTMNITIPDTSPTIVSSMQKNISAEDITNVTIADLIPTGTINSNITLSPNVSTNNESISRNMTKEFQAGV